MTWLALALAAAPSLASAQALNLFYERTVMSAADQRCRLFDTDVASALGAATFQARGAALRAGISGDEIKATADRARAKAAGADCASKDLAVASSRVRNAFEGYARIARQNYPGDIAGWDADRNIPRDTIIWKLRQDARFGRDGLIFGIAGKDTRAYLMAVARFADGATPYAARLVMRDDLRSTGPYLDRWTGGATKAVPLARRLPPHSALTEFAAEARSPAGTDLLPKGATEGWAFRFPREAAERLARLDPREAIAVEFLFPGDEARRAYVEVGDFAAGRAFLRVAVR